MQQFLVPVYPVEREEIPAILRQKQIFTNDYAKQYMAHPRFQTQQGPEQVPVVVLSLTELGLPDGGVLPELLEQVRRQGFRLCRPSLGFYLRLCYQGQAQSANSQLTGGHRAPEGSITVLSQPLERQDTFPKGLYLRKVEGALWLRGYVCDDTHCWSPEDLFALEQQQ